MKALSESALLAEARAFLATHKLSKFAQADRSHAAFVASRLMALGCPKDVAREFIAESAAKGMLGNISQFNQALTGKPDAPAAQQADPYGVFGA